MNAASQVPSAVLISTFVSAASSICMALQAAESIPPDVRAGRAPSGMSQAHVKPRWRGRCRPFSEVRNQALENFGQGIARHVFQNFRAGFRIRSGLAADEDVD